jgi:hypothetical protein
MRTQILTFIFLDFLVVTNSQILYELFVVNILPVLPSLLFNSIVQLLVMIPFIKYNTNKQYSKFYLLQNETQKKVDELIIKIKEYEDKDKQTNLYLRGVETEVKKFYYAESEINRYMIQLSASMDTLSTNVHSLTLDVKSIHRKIEGEPIVFKKSLAKYDYYKNEHELQEKQFQENLEAIKNDTYKK